MRKILLVVSLIGCLFLTACAEKAIMTENISAPTSSDYNEAVELAKEEFATIFKDHAGLQIEETMASGQNEGSVSIQITFSSDDGNGVYGFVYQKDEDGIYQMVLQGADVTIQTTLEK